MYLSGGGTTIHDKKQKTLIGLSLELILSGDFLQERFVIGLNYLA